MLLQKMKRLIFIRVVGMTDNAGVFVKWLAALFVRPQATGNWALQIDEDLFVSNHLTNTIVIGSGGKLKTIF